MTPSDGQVPENQPATPKATEATTAPGATAPSATSAPSATTAPSATEAPTSALTPHRYVEPATTEPFARAWTNFIGGPLGDHGLRGTQRYWTPWRLIVLVGSFLLSLGFLSKAHCVPGAINEEGTPYLSWPGHRQNVWGCYNDIIPLFGGRGLDQPGFPYAFSWTEGDLTRYMEYPVLAGLFQGLVGSISRATFGLVPQFSAFAIPPASWYFIITCVILGFMWLATLNLVARLMGPRIWDTMIVAGSPMLIVHAFTNWDIPSILLATLAMYCVARNRPGLAGLFIGLGTAFKLWPLFLLGAYLVLTWRTRRWPEFLRMLAVTVISWVVVNAPIYYLYPEAWHEFFRLNRTRGPEWTTIWAVASRLIGTSTEPYFFEPKLINTLSFLLFALSCAAIFFFGIRLKRTPRAAELMVLIIAAFLIFNKVWSPQYSLWLLIPAAFALPRWRLLFAWGVTEILVWRILFWFFLGADNKGAPGALLNLIVLIRDAFIIAIVVLVIRQMLAKTTDKVRATSSTDPHYDRLAGCFHTPTAAPKTLSAEVIPADAALPPTTPVQVAGTDFASPENRPRGGRHSSGA